MGGRGVSCLLLSEPSKNLNTPPGSRRRKAILEKMSAAAGQRLRLLRLHLAPHPLREVAVNSAASGQQPAVECLDYAYSFITGDGPENAIRFAVESRTTVYDEQAGTAVVYYQCASCKSEDTFGRGIVASSKGLFQDPNYDFCPVRDGVLLVP